MWNIKKKIFIVGIGGISLSAIAVILKSDGHEVSGSDLVLSKTTDSLQKKGIKIFKGHDSDNVLGFDLLIHSSAVPESNVEIQRARELGIPIFSRAKIIGMLSRRFKNTISIAGSHGKTTTTGIISTILINAGLDPTVHIGGNFSKIAGNVRVGESSFFVTEACEYVDSFLELSSRVGIVLNVQADHLDFFKNVKRVESSFKKFAMRTKRNGVLIVFGGDTRANNLEANAKKLTFGFSSQFDYFASNLSCDVDGKFSFDCFEKGKLLGKVDLSIPGRHNVLNTLAAISTSRFFGIDFHCIRDSIREFQGTDRRFEFVAEFNGARVIHDYAHHPTELKAILSTAKQIAKNKIISVFQPHTFSRTKSFFCAFAKSLIQADEVFLAPIYPAREKPINGITSDALAQKINELGGKAKYLQSFEKIAIEVKKKVEPGDIVLILGAGDIVELGEFFKNGHIKRV